MKTFMMLVVLLISIPVVSYSQDEGRAEVIFNGLCAVCHGVNGVGDGVSAPALIPPPPDFSSTEYKADKEAIVLTITKGNPGTQMEGFGGKLSADDINLLADFVIAF